MDTRKRNLIKYILPSVAGMCSTFLYVVVDGIFVGQGIGVDALGAVNIALPFTMLMMAFSTLTSIGGVTVTAIRLGRGDTKGANDAFLHAVYISVIIALAMMLVGMIFPRQIAAISGANSTFLDMSSEYIFYFSAFSLPLVLCIIVQGFIRNDGSPVLAGVAVIAAAAVNIFLDWLFIFPLQFGIKGAAIASGLGQVVGVVIMLLHFIRKKGVLRFVKRRFSLKLTGKIMKRGTPEMISQFGAPVMTLSMNYVLIKNLGDLYVSAFSVMSYLLSFSMGVFIGVSVGLQPLIGQSYGEKNTENLKYYFRSGLVITFLSSLGVYAILSVFGEPICRLFSADPALISIVSKSIPKFGLAFLMMSLNLLISSYLYSTKRTKQALIVAICRCIILNSSIILLLPMIFGSGIIWYTAAIAEFLSLIIAVALLKHSERNGVIFQ